MTTIRAAGGVVWRPGDAEIEVCLVHRPRYDDWSLPKGKLEPGEHPLSAAVREVAEEADTRAVPQVRLPQVRYLTREGIRKEVDYWSMRAVGWGGFQPQTEVDAIRWLPIEAAITLASYVHDARVIRDFASLPPVTAVLALVPYEGGEPGERLAPLLALLRPRRLLAAPARDRGQPPAPLAELLQLPIEVEAVFAGPEPGRTAQERVPAAAARLAALAGFGAAAVVCIQESLIPGVLAALRRSWPIGSTDRPWGSPSTTTVGNCWLLAFNADRLVAADPLLGGDR
ncbi:MAG TPA: NUDIX hydrolase [Micromonospora sp.]|nr:NUDIX hydrolase [Micromonospora sp.]